jgi:hypothetical protein
MRSRNYGVAGWHVAPHRVRLGAGTTLLEVPVAVCAAGRWRFPVAGGGYFRVLPKQLLVRALLSISRNRPAIVYCHPYEFNRYELDDYRGKIPRSLRAGQSLGRGAFPDRIRTLLTRLRFGRFDEVLEAWGVA